MTREILTAVIIALLVGSSSPWWWSEFRNVFFSSATNASTPLIGKINVPSLNQEVSRTFYVSGTINDLPQDHELWLAIQIGNMLWPNIKITPLAGKWSTTISENGNPPGGHFSIVLLVTNPSTTALFEDWFKEGIFAGMEIKKLNEIMILDVVHLKLK